VRDALRAQRQIRIVQIQGKQAVEFGKLGESVIGDATAEQQIGGQRV